MKGFHRMIWLGAILATLCVYQICAEDELPCTCGTSEVIGDSLSTHPQHPNHVYDTFKTSMINGDWKTVGEGLLSMFAELQSQVSSENREMNASRLGYIENELKAVLEEFTSETWGADLAAREEKVWASRFHITDDWSDQGTFSLFTQHRDGTPRDSVLVVGETDSISVARAICWTAIAARRVLARLEQEGRQQAAESMRRYVELWGNYNQRGYRQYPWELWANSRVYMRENEMHGVDLLPPEWQLVLVHPSVGFELNGQKLDELHRFDTAFLEPFGLVRYVNDRKSYIGLSSVLSFPGEAAVGLGPLLHLGRVAKVGYVFRSSDADNGLVVSIDLYSWLSKVPAQLEDAKKRAAEKVETLQEQLKD